MLFAYKSCRSDFACPVVYLPKQMSMYALQVLQILKKGLDPNGIMNPYKMGL